MVKCKHINNYLYKNFKNSLALALEQMVNPSIIIIKSLHYFALLVMIINIRSKFQLKFC
jgi:hypothetical protein